jgi:hypothetical protein
MNMAGAYALPTFDLSNHFRRFFGALNPGISFIRTASSQYNTIKGLIEDRRGLASVLSPRCFLQGSYDQSTAIYTINDVDIIALCELWQPGSGAGAGASWDRNTIFGTIAAPLLNDGRYRNKVHYSSTSMCIKVELGIKVEILPVVFKQGTNDPQAEPFRLWRPERNQWEDGYARYHQAHLSLKNAIDRSEGNFIPMIKVLKHLRSKHNLRGVSFHIECLLHALPDWPFKGSAPTYIRDALNFLASHSAIDWYQAGLMTPCGDRNIFTPAEWSFESWSTFHQFVSIWARFAQLGSEALSQQSAISIWQELLGADFFPAIVTT